MKTIFKPIKFPKDESIHNHMVEWWYFNGHLKDKNGRHYSFMDCLFKVNIKKLGVPFADKMNFKNFYFAHSIVSDIKGKKNNKDIKNSALVSKDSFKRPLLFVNYTDLAPIHGYGNSIMEETKSFSYRIKNDNLDLNMELTKKPLLEGGKGFTNVCGNKSFYYSLTNLKTSGIIVMDKKIIEVSGKAWMEHQWTNSTGYYNDRWNWFSIQLDDNTEIACCEYISGDKRDYWADILYPNNKQESLKILRLKPDKIWKSRETKEEYPLQWELELPEKKIKLKISALMDDQEVKAGFAKYWEGPTKVVGTFGRKKVKGLGFMELVNHASPYGNYSIEEIKKTISKIF